MWVSKSSLYLVVVVVTIQVVSSVLLATRMFSFLCLDLASLEHTVSFFTVNNHFFCPHRNKTFIYFCRMDLSFYLELYREIPGCSDSPGVDHKLTVCPHGQGVRGQKLKQGKFHLNLKTLVLWGWEKLTEEAWIYVFWRYLKPAQALFSTTCCRGLALAGGFYRGSLPTPTIMWFTQRRKISVLTIINVKHKLWWW